jgi:hypothetical protein
MRAMKNIALALTLALTLLGPVACGKKSSDSKASDKPTANAPATPGKPGAAPATPPAAAGGAKVKPYGDMSKLTIDKKDWDPQFNDALKDWTLEKYTQNGDENAANRFVIMQLDEDAPTTMDEYATKLQVKDFQDFGYKYSAIASKAPLPNGGWLIKGTVVTDPPMADAKPEPGFVALVDIGGAKVLCKSETMTSDKIVDEAVAICSSLK